MERDFSQINEEEGGLVVPNGMYLCRIADVRERKARDGSPQWGLQLEAVGGDYAGRTLAWDNITWSERGVFRIKKVLAALGFDVSGLLSVEPSQLVDLRVQVLLEVEEYENLGGTTRRMAVPYNGYFAAGAEDLPLTADAQVPMPF